MKDPQNFFSADYYYGAKNSNYLNYDRYDRPNFWRHVTSKIKRYGMEGRVLDIGCAFGFLLKRLASEFSELHGIDISEYAIERARKEVPHANLDALDIDATEDLPYQDGYFDLITALDVLEHTELLKENVRKIRRKLKKGGHLIASLPLKDSWAGKLFRLFDKDASHVSIVTRQQIKDMVEAEGLRVLEEEYFLNIDSYRIQGVPAEIELLLQNPAAK